MARPLQEKSLSGATSTGAGSQIETGGRITLSLFAATDTNPGTLDVELEVSMDGTNWTSFTTPGDSQELEVTTSEFSDPSGNGNYAAFSTAHGIAARYVRARITGYSSAGNVDVWVGATSNAESTMDYRGV